MLHICCIRAGTAFGPEYVTNLKDMIARNLEEGLPGRFVCFTDRPHELPEGIETAPLPADLPGWWSKLALFKAGLFPADDDVIFFDLDTLIVGPIDRLVQSTGRLALLRDFYRPHGLQSSVMTWKAGLSTDIWETYKAAGCPMDDPGGDQAWIEKVRPGAKRLQALFPGMFVSYKQCKGIPDDASVVIFHGRPRPHEVLDGWVPQVWKEGGISRFELKAICNTERDRLLDNVRSCIARPLNWFKPAEQDHNGHVAIIGGGPSLVDKIDELRWRQSVGQQVWVLNNAHKALDGFKFDAQVLLDARVETASFITEADRYLVASQCDPSVFDALEGKNVTVWHANTPGIDEVLSPEWERKPYLIGGGTTVGMNALALASLLGFQKIHLYGFDSSYRDGAHHAYPQPLNDDEKRVDALHGGKTYLCAPWMIGQTEEFIEKWPYYKADGRTITVHGTGLLFDVFCGLWNSITPAEVRAEEIIKRVGPEAHGVEIGVFAGETSQQLLKAGISLIMVDSWEGNGAAYIGDSGDFHAGLDQKSQDALFEMTKRRVAFANGHSRIIRKRSLDALDDVPDESCDFVFIDADHSYEGCKADIEGWFPKVKQGGWIGGHDYKNADFEKFGVTRAVDEFIGASNLTLETGENFCWFARRQ